jgi:4-amino-4-deoxy-L-arabinose transferase-like glycosyltransferase
MSATAHAQVRPRARLFDPREVSSRGSAPAWGTIGLTLVFIALTCWWLTQDRSIPIYDAGDHLETAIHYHQLVQSGDLLGPFNSVSQYPPLAYIVGVLAMFVGGVNLASPIIGENLIFVSLLTLGCYQAGRLLFGSAAGLLAAIFVLGSPLLIAQFHVFMLDAPETALVAISIWLLLASKRFSRTGIAAAAGLAVGCGLLVKVQFPFFLAGIVLTALARGGWREWRGLSAFAAVALLVGGPWYIDHLSELSTITKLAGTGSGAVAGNLPPTLSSANLTWYFWSTLNSQLLLPLFLLALGGAVWTIVALVRGEEARGPRLEFMIGGFVAWLAISLTPHHDIRYDMPLMPYLAILGTGWIVHLRSAPRLAATALLVLAVLANTLGTTFGVGGQAEVKLVGSPPATQALPDRVAIYSNRGFLVAGPQRDGDVPGLLSALRSDGVEVVAFDEAQLQAADFSGEGLGPLAMIAGLLPSVETSLVNVSPTVAYVLHQSISQGSPPTCTRLSDRTGVWVLRRDPQTGKVEFYCPSRTPQYYE